MCPFPPCLCLKELFQGHVCCAIPAQRMECRVPAGALAAPSADADWHSSMLPAGDSSANPKLAAVPQSMLHKCLGPGLQLEVPATAACHFQETLSFSLHLLCLSPHPGRLCFIYAEIGYFYSAVIRFPYTCSRHWGWMVMLKVIQLHMQLDFMSMSIHLHTEMPSGVFFVWLEVWSLLSLISPSARLLKKFTCTEHTTP